MANIPQYDTRNFSFGPGILYIAPYDITNNEPVYPDIDVGAVRAGAELRITREILDVMQGSPDTIVKSFVRSETVELSVVSIEWKLENLKLALGGGDIDQAMNIFRFGGSMDLDVYSLRFVHETPAGDKWVIKIWKANPTGEMTITFGNDDVHEFALNFRALKAFKSWKEPHTLVIGEGNGSTTNFTGILRTQVIPGSVTVTDGTQTLQDDGNGSLSGDGSGSVDYLTGDIGVSFSSAPASGSKITVSYQYQFELSQTACLVEVEKIPA